MPGWTWIPSWRWRRSEHSHGRGIGRFPWISSGPAKRMPSALANSSKSSSKPPSEMIIKRGFDLSENLDALRARSLY